MEEQKYLKEESITYFERKQKVSIEDIHEGEIILLTVNSPYNYGISEWEMVGKLVKKTKCYFEILWYFNVLWRNNSCKTESIKTREENPKRYTKKWAKKSIVEIYTAEITEKIEIREYYNYNKNEIK